MPKETVIGAEAIFVTVPSLLPRARSGQGLATRFVACAIQFVTFVWISHANSTWLTS